LNNVRSYSVNSAGLTIFDANNKSVPL